MATGQGPRRRGEVEALPSVALRVRAYAGIDPVTRKRHHLVETVLAGPKAAKQAEKVRTKLLAEVDAGHQPRTTPPPTSTTPPPAAPGSATSHRAPCRCGEAGSR